MDRRMTAAVFAAALGAAVLGFALSSWLTDAAPGKAVLAASGSAAATDRPFHSSVKDLMDSVIDPSADVLWGAVGTIIDTDTGPVERVPKTEDEWHDVRRAAVRIIEGANLLTLPGREAAPPGTRSETPGVELEPMDIAALIAKDRGAFDGFAMALQALGREVLKAGEEKNAELLLDAGGRMENVCESCHQTFWYPNASAPQAAAK